MKQTRQDKLNEKRIEQAFYARCSGIQVNVMDISKVFKHGRMLIADGADDAVLGDGLLAFAMSIAK